MAERVYLDWNATAPLRVEAREAMIAAMDALTRGAGASGADQGTEAQGLTDKLWEQLSAHVYVFLHQTRLSDVIANELVPCPAMPNLFAVVDEA